MEVPIADTSLAKRKDHDRGRVQKHPASFQCTSCPKRFTTAYNLRCHLRAHEDLKPFDCTVCGKSFVRDNDRKRHERSHSGERKFVCQGVLEDGRQWGCKKRFALAQGLGRHLRTELGRTCIQPLLDEETRTRPRNLSNDQSKEVLDGNCIELPSELLQRYQIPAEEDWGVQAAGAPQALHASVNELVFDFLDLPDPFATTQSSSSINLAHQLRLVTDARDKAVAERNEACQRLEQLTGALTAARTENERLSKLVVHLPQKGQSVPASASLSTDYWSETPETLRKNDPIGVQVWKLYHKTRGQVPNSERLENLSWRMMSMSLRRRQLERQG